MKDQRYGDEEHMLAAIIAEALHIADSLDLSMVGISLSGALDRLHGLTSDEQGASVH